MKICWSALALINPALPHPALSLFRPGIGSSPFDSAAGQERGRERLLDPLPAVGVLAVAGRKSPDGVEVVRQQDDRDEFERAAPLRRRDRPAETPSAQVGRQNRTPLVGHHGEEVGPTRDVVPSVVRHATPPPWLLGQDPAG